MGRAIAEGLISYPYWARLDSDLGFFIGLNAETMTVFADFNLRIIHYNLLNYSAISGTEYGVVKMRRYKNYQTAYRALLLVNPKPSMRWRLNNWDFFKKMKLNTGLSLGFVTEK